MVTTERRITAVRHIGIVVRDLERSLRFYRDALGLRVVRAIEESGAYLDSLLALRNAQVKTVKLAAPDGPAVIELLQFDSHPDTTTAQRPIYAVGPSHVAFSVEDLDAVYHRLAQAGVSFNAPPQRSPDSSAKVCCCQDPDGMTIELVEAVQSSPHPASRRAEC